MCGIAGQIAISPDARIDLALIPQMAALLAHRGPDGWGYAVDPSSQVALLNTRLAIVDRAGGRQPICNEDGQIWVTLNGECYGFERERRWLESRGHRFRTRTDTEVLVHLYEEFGDAFVNRLRGEYAFALHDRRRGVCLLVRDRFGIKPLVFTEHRGRLLFASEAKALFADDTIERTLDREHVVHAVCGIFLPHRTFFRGVHQVEPGSMLRVEVGSRPTTARYWQLPFRPESERSAEVVARQDASGGRGDADALAEFDDKLREAIRIRLHGDVEVGAYLSGGVDSAAVVQGICESTSALRTFTVGFDDPRFDETTAASLVAQHFAVPNQVVRIGADLAEAFEASQWHNETPVVNGHGAAKFLLSRTAASQVKAVLTGEGADELLAGYSQFQHQQLLEACQRSPGDQDAAERITQFMATHTVFGGITSVHRYPHYEEVVSQFGAYPYSAARMYAIQRHARWLVFPEWRRVMSGPVMLDSLEATLGVKALEGFDPITASQVTLFRTQLPVYILANLADRPEMAHGLEGRTPFLDHELVELACALPIRLKLAPHRSKHALRCFVERAMPAAAMRPKHVFMAPSARTLGLDRSRSPLEEWLLPRALRDARVFSPLGVSLLRRIVRHTPRPTRASGLAEMALVFALSVSVLDGLFCRGFAAARARYAANPARFSLGSGDVSTNTNVAAS